MIYDFISDFAFLTEWDRTRRKNDRRWFDDYRVDVWTFRIRAIRLSQGLIFDFGRHTQDARTDLTDLPRTSVARQKKSRKKREEKKLNLSLAGIADFARVFSSCINFHFKDLFVWSRQLLCEQLRNLLSSINFFISWYRVKKSFLPCTQHLDLKRLLVIYRSTSVDFTFLGW